MKVACRRKAEIVKKVATKGFRCLASSVRRSSVRLDRVATASATATFPHTGEGLERAGFDTNSHSISHILTISDILGCLYLAFPFRGRCREATEEVKGAKNYSSE